MYIQFKWCNPADLYDYNKSILCWTKNNHCIYIQRHKELETLAMDC